MHHSAPDNLAPAPGGVQFTFGDGRVQLVSDGVDLATYQGLCTIRDDEILGTY